MTTNDPVIFPVGDGTELIVETTSTISHYTPNGECLDMIVFNRNGDVIYSQNPNPQAGEHCGF